MVVYFGLGAKHLDDHSVRHEIISKDWFTQRRKARKELNPLRALLEHTVEQQNVECKIKM
jgi:cytolysin (calcineurin-like family phosphatase)